MKTVVRKKKNVFFNYSSQTLTPCMTNLLNRGINFSILPDKIDMTQVNVNLKRFKRAQFGINFDLAGRVKIKQI